MLARLSQAREKRVALPELAREAGLTVHHFQRTFARLVRESPKQFTRRLQLECGAALLLSTEDAILDVALAVGFESHEGFTRAFTRHFGRSPKRFRTEGLASGSAERSRQAEIVTHVGPCLRLFRTNLSTPDQRKTKVSYDIVRETIQPMTLLGQTARCEQAEIAETLGRVLGATFGHATQNGITMTGPPVCRYLNWGPGMVTLQAGVPVVPGAKGTEDIEVVEIPGGEAAVTVHTGPYDGLGSAHAAIEAYLHEHGLRAAGPPIEIYVTDPGEVPDPADWKTRIIWPLES